MTINISLINCGIGNIKSVEWALRAAGADVVRATSPQQVSDAGILIFPGVGSFEGVISRLHEKGLDQAILDHIAKGNPYLGICVGMQILFDFSLEFGTHKGLGTVPGAVELMEKRSSSSTKTGPDKIPFVNWSPILQPDENDWSQGIFRHCTSGDHFYFVHSMQAKPGIAAHIEAVTDYNGLHVCAAVRNDNIIGTQFHPEKSAQNGNNFFRGFFETFS